MFTVRGSALADSGYLSVWVHERNCRAEPLQRVNCSNSAAARPMLQSVYGQRSRSLHDTSCMASVRRVQEGGVPLSPGESPVARLEAARSARRVGRWASRAPL